MAKYQLHQAALEANARQLAQLAQAADCTIVMALKAFATPQLLPLIAQHIPGVCASGSWEAQLAHHHFTRPDEQPPHIITCAPAYSQADIDELLPIATILDFNSLSQWAHFKDQILAHPRYQNQQLKAGLRLNPQHSTQHGTPLYDPCAPGSRLGITADQLNAADPQLLQGLQGLHFHTLCEQGVEPLQSTLQAIESQFSQHLQAPWCQSLNLGGGHWITKPDYDRQALIDTIRHYSQKWNLHIILEPGEAFAIHSGTLIATVLDIQQSAADKNTNKNTSPNSPTSQTAANVILDISATCHMPDTLEMPYRPELKLADGTPSGNPDAPQNSPQHQPDQPHHYRLGGPSCLAGDHIGNYSFPRPLQLGDQLHFQDMAHYTMVKTTTFNGVKHPDITLLKPDGSEQLLRQFSYQDFKNRLG